MEQASAIISDQQITTNMADNEKTSISTSHQEEAGNVQEAHYDHRSHSDKEKNTAHGSSSDLSSTAEVESINVGQRGRRASVATTARSHRESFHSQRSVDPAEVQAAVPGHDLDVELAQVNLSYSHRLIWTAIDPIPRADTPQLN